MPDVTPASAGKEVAPAGVAESDEKIALNELGKKAVAAIDKKLKANQIPDEIAIKARTILGLGDDFAKGKAALNLLMDIAIAEEEEEGPGPGRELRYADHPPPALHLREGEDGVGVDHQGLHDDGEAEGRDAEVVGAEA